MNEDEVTVVTLHNTNTGQQGELDEDVLKYIKFLARCHAEDDFRDQIDGVAGDTEDNTEE